MAKIAIIGAGQVGSAVGFALAEASIAQEIVLVDLNMDCAQAAALDIAHGVPAMPPVEIRAGGYPDIIGADLVIFTAGAKQKEGEARTELAGRNRMVVEFACREIVRYAPSCLLLMVSNPVDVLTSIALNASSFPRNRVFGSGTVLDSMRMRAMIAKHAGVDARDVHAWVLGEHGDSEVPAWSVARIGGLGIDEYCRLSGDCAGNLEAELRAEFDGAVRGAAQAIIRGKGATSHGVAVAVRRIAEALLRDEHSVLTVSAQLSGEMGLRDVALSLPCVLGSGGVERVLPLTLSDEERRALARSAEIIRRTAFESALELV